MTEEEKAICLALGSVSCLPGTWDKRMLAALHFLSRPDSKPISDSQREWMYRLLYKYRRQVPATYEKHKTHPHCKKLNPPQVNED